MGSFSHCRPGLCWEGRGVRRHALSFSILLSVPVVLHAQLVLSPDLWPVLPQVPGHWQEGRKGRETESKRGIQKGEQNTEQYSDQTLRVKTARRSDKGIIQDKNRKDDWAVFKKRHTVRQKGHRRMRKIKREWKNISSNQCVQAFLLHPSLQTCCVQKLSARARRRAEAVLTLNLVSSGKQGKGFSSEDFPPVWVVAEVTGVICGLQRPADQGYPAEKQAGGVKQKSMWG